eukprot:TRINITY_DN16387_c0_g1_i1.p1 TRINITY_DN16387_c0_g1~~TRINITY_DN16387_c0_g1_i1.p1  ORF type:complete len:503 (+),score=73.00 TRINITY_DN16387_c0_g1_i1:170-1510(+)
MEKFFRAHGADEEEDVRCSIFFDMRSLFEASIRDSSDPSNQGGTDFTFKLLGSSPSKRNDAVLKAHKCILAARSPYFFSLFSQPETSRVDTETLHASPEVMEKILYHIYTDDVLPYGLEEANQMQLIAKKYELRKLENDVLKRTSRSRVIRSSSSDALNFRSLLNNSLLSDVTIVVPSTGERLNAHRAILGSRGRYFRSVFSGIYNDSRSQEITMATTTELEKDRVMRILEYVYTDSLSFRSLKDSLEMMQASHYFLLPGMQYLCEEFVASSLQADNINFLWKLSRSLPKSPLIEECCERYLVNNMHTVIYTPAFLHFDKEFLLKVLSSGELDVDIIELTEAIFRWGQANLDGENRNNNLDFHSVHDGMAHLATESDTEWSSNNEDLEEKDSGDNHERISVIESLHPVDRERIQNLILDMLPPKTMFNREIRQSLLSNSTSNLFSF